MHDVALRRRIAALVIAALLAISGAALATAYFAADAGQDTLIALAGDDDNNGYGGRGEDYIGA